MCVCLGAIRTPSGFYHSSRGRSGSFPLHDRGFCLKIRTLFCTCRAVPTISTSKEHSPNQVQDHDYWVLSVKVFHISRFVIIGRPSKGWKVIDRCSNQFPILLVPTSLGEGILLTGRRTAAWMAATTVSSGGVVISGVRCGRSKHNRLNMYAIPGKGLDRPVLSKSARPVFRMARVTSNRLLGRRGLDPLRLAHKSCPCTLAATRDEQGGTLYACRSRIFSREP